MGKKVISFSLFGEKPKYTLNAIINCIYAQHFMLGWVCRFYYVNNVPTPVLEILGKFENVELIEVEKNDCPVYARFNALEDEEIDVVIFRDADSWISKRDQVLVNEWLLSDKDIHMIRDHCHHRSPIMAGTWGVRNHALHGITKYHEDYPNGLIPFILSQDKGWWTNDQIWLNKWVYHPNKERMFVHGVLNPPMEKEEFAVPIPDIEIEEVPGLPLKEVSDCNAHTCDMCDGVHSVFIGSQLNNLTGPAYNYLRKLKEDMGVEGEIPGL